MLLRSNPERDIELTPLAKQLADYHGVDRRYAGEVLHLVADNDNFRAARTIADNWLLEEIDINPTDRLRCVYLKMRRAERALLRNDTGVVDRLFEGYKDYINSDPDDPNVDDNLTGFAEMTRADIEALLNLFCVVPLPPIHQDYLTGERNPPGFAPYLPRSLATPVIVEDLNERIEGLIVHDRQEVNLTLATAKLNLRNKEDVRLFLEWVLMPRLTPWINRKFLARHALSEQGGDPRLTAMPDPNPKRVSAFLDEVADALAKAFPLWGQFTTVKTTRLGFRMQMMHDVSRMEKTVNTLLLALESLRVPKALAAQLTGFVGEYYHGNPSVRKALAAN